MNLHVIKKKFRQEVILDVNGCLNSKIVIAQKFLALCLKVLGGLVLTLVLAPISLFRPIRILVKRKQSESKASFFIEDFEGTLRELKTNKKFRKTVVISPLFSSYPNAQLAKMYSNHVLLLLNRSRIIHELFDYVWPIFDITRSSVRNSSPEYFKNWNSCDSIISFSKSEVLAGRNFERQLFGDEAKPWATICLGSARYRKIVDFKGSDLPNSLTIVGIEQYGPAIEFLAEQGLNIVRFGTHVDEDIPTYLKGSIFDATSVRSDFTDVWINSECKFILSGVSGGWWLGAPFNKPVACTNGPFPIGSHGFLDLFIPCMPWLVKKNSFASFEWQFRNFGWSTDSSKLGSEYIGVQNSSLQIVDLVDEILKRLSGKWYESVEDMKLQARFKNLQNILTPNLRTPARIGAKFLREHQYLLPD